MIIPTDKLLHCSISFIITTVMCALFASNPHFMFIGGITAFLIGIGKEIYDKLTYRSAIADQLFDLAFDIVGIGAALFCISAF